MVFIYINNLFFVYINYSKNKIVCKLETIHPELYENWMGYFQADIIPLIFQVIPSDAI